MQYVLFRRVHKICEKRLYFIVSVGVYVRLREITLLPPARIFMKFDLNFYENLLTKFI
jgi:hypothetical protein